MLTFMGRCRELLLYQRIFSPGKGKIFVVVLAYKADRDSRWVLSLRVFSKIFCCLVLENCFPDIEQLSGPQNEALFGILNQENVFTINHIPVLSISLPRIIFKRVSLSKKCHCGSRCPFNSLVMSHIRELHTREILKTAK